MPTIIESLGMAQAMSDTNIPYIISFMITKEGKLLDGTYISDAIEKIDSNTVNKPIFYMSNCVYPSVVVKAIENDSNNKELLKKRFLGVQGNASNIDFSKLNNSTALKTSSPNEFIASTKPLIEKNLKIFGGCCGTSNLHIEAIAKMISEIK